MNNITIISGLVIGSIAPVVISWIVEALRSAPKVPEKLHWSPEITIRYIDINGNSLRYIVTGEGPVLVLLHTLFSGRLCKVVSSLRRHIPSVSLIC